MNFRPRPKEEPEINLIPFIDVLLVILIFLMLTTTYSKFTEVQLKLPVADTDVQRDYPREIIVTVTSDGRYTVKGTPVPGRGRRTLPSRRRRRSLWSYVRRIDRAGPPPHWGRDAGGQARSPVLYQAVVL